MPIKARMATPIKFLRLNSVTSGLQAHHRGVGQARPCGERDQASVRSGLRTDSSRKIPSVT
jgi:hypothetical protein